MPGLPSVVEAGLDRRAARPSSQGISFQSVFPDPMTRIADRIEVNPDVHYGKPVSAGTRVPVHMVLGVLGEGRSVDEILDEYYTREDVLACIRYAHSVLEEEDVHAGRG